MDVGGGPLWLPAVAPLMGNSCDSTSPTGGHKGPPLREDSTSPTGGHKGPPPASAPLPPLRDLPSVLVFSLHYSFKIILR